MKRYYFFNLLLLLSLGLAGCAGPYPSGQTDERRSALEQQDTLYIENAWTLADYLRRTPGVNVNGNNISIRGGGSPLFIIDGTWVGNSYSSAANLVNVEDIASVEVLKNPSETALYGRYGGNGVIIIHTRGANPKAGKYQ
ncbi:MAG: TonB-dependent receptor plug domain-containing protein [Lewinellaceae bacterium]|nr:TonB-dependent receptor plug domain-containing protein [Phaeodactylibacter sp.]MCB9035011.1 TonB-dependent receptor plug domain-containing protein [Lewinellaceae bacterium]